MIDLTEFLLTRIAEDEAVAREALPPTEWAVTTPPPETPSLTPIVGTGLSYNVEAARHIGRWQPARVLAECEAKRQAVQWCDDDPLCHDGGWAYTDKFLRFLALPYADHPDYREEWKL